MQLYHCHATPLKKHIHKGLYGAFIIDPPEPRPPAQELVMVMNGFDTDGDGENNFYTVNGKAFYYAKYPIRVKRSETVRIYLANLTEFDLINSFHLHGEFFRYYRTGSTDQFEYTDTVMQCQGERGIVEIDFAPPRALHVPRPPVRVRRARLDGLLRGRGRVSTEPVARRRRPLGRAPAGAGPDRPAGGDRRRVRGVGRLDHRPGGQQPAPARHARGAPGRVPRRARSRLLVRNPQPEDITIAVVTVDDAVVPFTVDGAHHPRAPALGDDRRSRSRGSRTTRT